MRRIFGGTRRAVAAAVLGSVIGAAAAAFPAYASTGRADTPEPGATSHFWCRDMSQAIAGGGTMVSGLATVGGETSGWVHFLADDGQRVKYFDDYTVEPNGGGGEALGSIVTPAGPLYGSNWLYISGTASFASSGELGSYSGTAVDICSQLGYPATF